MYGGVLAHLDMWQTYSSQSARGKGNNFYLSMSLQCISCQGEQTGVAGSSLAPGQLFGKGATKSCLSLTSKLSGH